MEKQPTLNDQETETLFELLNKLNVDDLAIVAGYVDTSIYQHKTVDLMNFLGIPAEQASKEALGKVEKISRIMLSRPRREGEDNESFKARMDEVYGEVDPEAAALMKLNRAVQNFKGDPKIN